MVTVQLRARRIADLNAGLRILPGGDPVVLDEGVRSSQDNEDSLTVSNQIVGVHPVSRSRGVVLVLGPAGVAQRDARPLPTDDRVIPNLVQVFTLAVQVDGVEVAADDVVLRHEIIVRGELQQMAWLMPAIEGITDDDIVTGIIRSVRVVLSTDPSIAMP